MTVPPRHQPARPGTSDRRGNGDPPPSFALLNAAPDAMVVADRQGRIVFVNTPFEELFEYRTPDILGKPVEVLVPASLRAGYEQIRDRCWNDPRARARVSRQDLYAETQNGRRFPIELSVSILRSGEESFLVAAIRDISSRVSTEESLIRSESSLDELTKNLVALLESTADLVYFKDKNHRFTAVSQSFAELTGHGHWRDLVGKTDFDVFASEHAEIYRKHEKGVIHDGAEIRALEEPYYDRNGQICWAITDKKPIFDNFGGVVGLFGISKDITELKRAAEELAQARDTAVDSARRHERRLVAASREAAQRRQVFMDATDPILIEDLTGRIIDLNREAERTYGWTREELIGRPVTTIVPPKRHEQAGGLLKRCLSGEEIRNVEGLRWSKDGTVQKVLVTLSRLTDDNGNVVSVATIAKDITALKEAEAKLQEHGRTLERRVAERTRELRIAKETAERATAAKSAFLATMSHEIRTPITGVNGMLELLELTELDGEQTGMVETIRDCAETLLAIINDILDFSKIEAGELHLEHIPFSLPAIIDGVQRVVAPAATQKGLSLTVDIDQTVFPILRGDPIRLRQVLFNLASNAIKFTDEGGMTISVGCDRAVGDRGLLRVEVGDTGIGIAPEKLESLFEPFTQADISTTRRRGGTGLGLAICRRLVGLMGGHISMESEVGKGTTVSVLLNLETVTDPAERMAAVSRFGPQEDRRPAGPFSYAPPSVAEAERRGTLVLLAEDHETNRRVILQQLAKLGFAAEAVANGAEALKAWESGRYGLVLTDCHMPEMDGYMLSRAIRDAEAKTGGHTPIVAITASALAEEARKCTAAGMDDYMTKPVSMSVLAEKLSSWIRPGRDEEASGIIRRTAKPERGPVDLSVLKQSVGSDPEVIRSLLASFQQTSVADHADLTKAVDGRDVDVVAEVAHRMKGAARMVGAAELADAAHAMETAARRADWPAVKQAEGSLRQALERALKHIESGTP